ncbi:hypothetical protein NQZ68_024636 [Dissostichus eleginoides]|nr:hypothetical protein NQZ68_024636 [Dissostichus eleginoides]
MGGKGPKRGPCFLRPRLLFWLKRTGRLGRIDPAASIFLSTAANKADVSIKSGALGRKREQPANRCEYEPADREGRFKPSEVP